MVIQIIHTVWVDRMELSTQLEVHKVPEFQSAGKEDYQRLVEKSKCWWQVLRLYKASKFPFGLRLVCPKTFASEEVAEGNGETSTDVRYHFGLGSFLVLIINIMLKLTQSVAPLGSHGVKRSRDTSMSEPREPRKRHQKTSSHRKTQAVVVSQVISNQQVGN